MRLGFIGTGTLAKAVIEGLIAVHGDRLEIVLSKRSESVARLLAERFPAVLRAKSNQQVVDEAEVVFVAVRPQDLSEALSGLLFRPNQTVVSFVAGARSDDVAQLVNPATRVLRVTPLPTVAQRRGPILVFPAAPDIEALFAELGTVIVPESQEQVMALGFAGGLMASFFQMANSGIHWLRDEGVPTEMGRDYLMSMYAALGTEGLNSPVTKLPDMPREFSTDGGINEACLCHLEAVGWFETFTTGLAVMKQHLEDLRTECGR